MAHTLQLAVALLDREPCGRYLVFGASVIPKLIEMAKTQRCELIDARSTAQADYLSPVNAETM